MDDLKTPVARLARLFRDARDKWKAKALERQKRLRAAQVRIRDLEQSRAYWKGRALAAEEQDAKSDTAAKTPVEDEDDIPPQWGTPVAHHHHALEVMQLSLQLFLHASLGCRGVSGVLQQFAAFLPLSVPAYTTVLNWSHRLGLAVLQRPLPRCDDWIFILDQTIALGEYKCLVVLGIPASRLSQCGFSPSHHDMTVLAVEITAHSTGLWVEAVLQRVAARAGNPVQIVSDHGSDVRKGIALFCQQAPSVVATYDISHAVATQLKAHWRDDPHWQAFSKQAGTTLSAYQQTDLAFLLPPRQRTKARYMAVEAQIDWAQRLLAYHDRGDFSAIGRPCVFSAQAWVHLRQTRGLSAVNPLRPLIGHRYDSRQALCAALRAQAASAGDDLHDAFWRLADRSYARFLEAFEWIFAYREVVPLWAQTIGVSKTVQTTLKTQGLSSATPARLKAKLAAPAPLPASVAAFQTQLLAQVNEQAAKLPDGAIWLASSDIIESVFGHYKTFTTRGPLKEVGRLVLMIPAFLTALTPQVIREAMTSVRTLDVEQWVETHLGDSMLKRRRQALKPT
ncbi:hypothetical protein U5801_18330 [Lamprobacter modestohalophilus]|uniref:hypothetical protein n=1 Tax=Lamprobacter modestohalophilus TaxID=1064514 RepID=UPI002ADEB0D6|nr:hypothetical protein [Lamprobacter modestohalophilus]MEA1051745.1 hypothetical protein [Lamprobacter modestohalophilus]